METAFKGIGYEVQSHELSYFHDDYGLEAPKGDEEDDDDDEDDDDEDDDDEDDDEDYSDDDESD